jgi:hypothetical protein
MKNAVQNIDLLDQIIVGRVTPHIYAFTTNTVPNYLKVGDTYRAVATRLEEWSRYFPELKKEYAEKATIDENVYFRDFSVHQFLEEDLQKHRLEPFDLPEGIYFSREFFEHASADDVREAVQDIENQYKKNSGKYVYYDAEKRLPESYHYERGPAWELRPNQKEAVDNFLTAVKNGRTNLLMYAVMRFGKSFTSLCCAKEINAKTILIVSAKADVREEWKKTVESAGNFSDFVFLASDDLLRDEQAIKNVHDANKTAVLFLTLQDLQGDEIKEKHLEVFANQIDLLIVDETHFGARAEEYGKVLKNAGQPTDDKRSLIKGEDDSIHLNDAEEQLKILNAKIRLHLSGTPYRILMGSEFEPEDIISFVQFADIVHEQEEWDRENLAKDDVNEWDNPYYGFPQMIRFAFNPNASSIKKMEELKKSGVSYAFSALLEPCSIKKDNQHSQHKQFIHEKEIFDLLQVIDGSKSDDEVLGFLDYDKIKDGKMCRHIVMVLPYCASCDAMEELIKKNQEHFLNLNQYEIINISGVEGGRKFPNPNSVKLKIRECEAENKKTLTLTVNRMLTGSTVEQWDTMIYLKDTSSPQEYDQAIFRLQNQYTRELVGEDGVIKENLKPQTLLVDFDPYRLFYMQEQKSLIYNVNTEENGNSKLKERLDEELRISPIITLNKNKIKQVEAINILEIVGRYNNKRSILDEVKDIPVDLNMLDDVLIYNTIKQQAEFQSKGGLSFKPYEGEGDDIDDDTTDQGDDSAKSAKESKHDPNQQEDEELDVERQVQTYYQRILCFAFLTKNRVNSLTEIVDVIDDGENIRLAKNMGLNKGVLERMSEMINPFMLSKLDYKIQNISLLANDESLLPIERALTSLKKFPRLSESEVMTPANIAEDMVGMISDDSLREMIENDEKILDIASKAGEFSVAIYKRLTDKLGFSMDKIKNTMYSIPTSTIAYEFTRRFYEILGFDVKNIAKKFTSYDLLDVKDEEDKIDYERVALLLKQTGNFADRILQDEIIQGEDYVKFGAVVGNPPYQVSDGGAQASARPIYQEFVGISEALCPDYASFIIPTRWFAGGKGLDEFREKMMKSYSIKELHDFLSPEDIFPETNNRGGVCYFLIEKAHTDPLVRVVTHNEGKIVSDVKRKLATDKTDLFIRDSVAISIINKVFTDDSQNDFSDWVSPRKPFGLESNIVKTENYKSTPTGLSSPVVCIGKGQQTGYIEKSLITSHIEWLPQWKVYIPRANNIGTELNDDNLNAFLGEPNTVCTEAYIVVGADKKLNNTSAENIVSYLKTKFARFLHRQAKSSHDASRKTYRFVPIQNFTETSKINWSCSVDEIDNQLFDIYGLSDSERTHIKNSIKDM